MATLTTLRTAVAYELGLDNTTSSADQTQIDRWLNEAVLRVLVDTHCYVKRSTTTTTADEADYELPSGVLALSKMKNTDETPLVHVSVEEIDDLRRGSTVTQAAPGIYRYAVDGANMLMLWPTPAGVETLTLYYVPRPTALSSGSDDTSSATYGGIPSEYDYAIELWAYARGSSADDDQSGAQGERYRQLYAEEIRRVRRAKLGKAGRKLAPARMSRRVLIPHVPSTDWR